MHSPQKRFNALRSKLWLFVAILALLPGFAIAQPADHALIGGLRINNGQPFGLIGTSIRIGDRLGLILEANPSPIAKAANGRLAYYIPVTERWTLIALEGPAVEGIPPDSILADPTYYLMNATGLALRYQTGGNLAVWAAVDYVTTGGRIKPWKFALGFSAPFSLKSNSDN